jgi:hypothetical protein
MQILLLAETEAFLQEDGNFIMNYQLPPCFHIFSVQVCTSFGGSYSVNVM